MSILGDTIYASDENSYTYTFLVNTYFSVPNTIFQWLEIDGVFVIKKISMTEKKVFVPLPLKNTKDRIL